ncbi:ABC-type antimicrobial peptide transport system permease subunit [Algoriphagus iocasae]|uniref:ABC-type antimicrobial peptide transport system permease subunit n=1 Tax=Algoriphagus iocasae TaxID=1836499 RepID=A0A841MBW5_9BACT|nr:FtsX-like permease family protein [Algoriphagus iocasae]MBB6325522.1 ABC-type antimicrobial peptide transport system permease subunit [Algoriphagus iocasae]
MDKKRHYYPPKLADRFLEFYCVPERLEQIQGDAYEIFYLDLEEKGLTYARLRFIFHVFSFFKWSNIGFSKFMHQRNNTGVMIRSYFKIGWRNILKQKGTTFISVFGLSCAVGCCIVAYLFIANIWFKGLNQPNKDELYQLVYTAEEADGLVTYGTVAQPISELIPNNLNQVKDHTRIMMEFPLLIQNNESFYQRTLYVDPSYMDMFKYRMEYGYPGALREADQVILTHQLSEKLFGDKHPIGQELSLVVDGEEKLFKVGGVLEDLKDMDMFNFDLLVNFESHPGAANDASLKDAWSKELWTFIQVEEGADISRIESDLGEITKIQNQVDPENPYVKMGLIAYPDIIYNVGKIEKGVRDFLGIGPQILLGTIGLFILLLAVFNYINLSVLMASKRLKEIGVRKVIGSKRSQLIFQFLSENLLVCFFAIFLGCMMAGFIFLPGFNDIASKNLQIDLFRDKNIWIFLGALLLAVTLITGLYPASYLSSFKPISILKGNQKIGSKSVFTSVLLSFQFTLAIISMVAAIAFVQTNYINANRDWGYSSADKIIVNVPDSKDYVPLRNKLSALSSVVEVSGSQDYVGNWITEKEVEFGDEKYSINFLNAESNYPELLDLELKQGRMFNSDLITDTQESLLVNQTFLDQFGLVFPLDQTVKIDSANYHVIGVVEDFHTEFFKNAIEPMAISASPDSVFNYLTLKMNPGSAEGSMDAVKKIWHETVPMGLFEGKLQTEVFEREIADANGVSKLISFSATLSVILALLGLFGLVSLNMTAHIKDYCVRKVFGADIGDLSKKLLKRYLIIWGIAALIGGIFSIYFISSFLDSFFAFNSGVGIIPIGFALVILLIVIIGTVSSQIWKVIKANPAVILKSE